MNKNKFRISVCIAAYNGSEYIKEQLDSIFSQIDPTLDEVIIIDDHSTDNTIDIVNNYSHSNLTILKNDMNIGVVKSFEKSIKNASGDIIVLSDQDDIWHENKIHAILEIFNKDSDIFCIVSDCKIIDSRNNILYPSFFELKKSKSGFWNNLYKNRYLGCSMAFRNCIKDLVLPFPKFINMHDEWIGLNCDLAGKVFFLDEILFSYRRHEKNVSSMKWSGLFRASSKRLIHSFYICFNFKKIFLFRKNNCK